AHCSAVEEFAHSLGLERGPLATLADDQPLRLAVEAPIWPDSRPVGDRTAVLDSEELAGALQGDLHLRAAVHRKHSAGRDLASLSTTLFATHGSLRSLFDPPA